MNYEKEEFGSNRYLIAGPQKKFKTLTGEYQLSFYRISLNGYYSLITIDLLYLNIEIFKNVKLKLKNKIRSRLKFYKLYHAI